MPSGTHISVCCDPYFLWFPGVGSITGMCKWPEVFCFDEEAQPVTWRALFLVDHTPLRLLRAGTWGPDSLPHGRVPGTQG